MKLQEKQQYILTIVVTLVALVGMVLYNLFTFYSNSVSNMVSIGESSLSQETEMLSSYLTKGMDVLQVTAITVEYMMQQGVSKEDIEAFLLEESERYKKDIDVNFTGIYGLFQGNYIDGIGWVHDADYVPKEREWYIAAKEAGGMPTVVSPYLDAQTNTIMISVSKLLYDKDSVISLDIVLDHVQTIIQDVQLNGIGYGFIVNDGGLVVAHSDDTQKGKNYLDENATQQLMQQIYKVQKGSFRTKVNNEGCTVFVDTVMKQWYVVMIVTDAKLYRDIRTILMRNSFVSLLVFTLTVSFSTLAFHRINLHMRNAETNRQRAENLNLTLMRTLARTIDAKDRYTNGHSQRVAKYSVQLARRMGKSEEECRNIYDAAILHDVGKIHISDAIINKPSRLTDEEYAHMKMHPVSGYYILRDIKENPMIAQGAKWHHERFDGKGYPNGLSGKDIPEIARIIGVADAYDAMTSNRSYRQVMPQHKVRDEIAKGRGTQFDPDIADIMLQMIDEDSAYDMRQKSKLDIKIMAIDDEPLYVNLIEYVLQDEQRYIVYKETDCIKALEDLKRTPMDLVFLDVQMPQMNGFEVYEKIREFSNVPVVFMTSDKTIETINRANAAGIEDYLVKPFMAQAVKEILQSILQEQLDS